MIPVHMTFGPSWQTELGRTFGRREASRRASLLLADEVEVNDMRRILLVSMTFGLVLLSGGPVAGLRGCDLTELGQWSEWGAPGEEQTIGGAIDVGIDVRGDVYVSDERNGLIHVLTTSGDYMRSFPAASPHGIAVDIQKVYNASWGESKVQVFDKSGSLLLEWGEWDENGTPMAFELPLFIDVDARGFIYVTDLILDQVRKFSSNGDWVATFGDGATAVSVQGHRVYVTNPAGTVDVFTLDGDFVRSFGSHGVGDGEFEDPRGIEVAGGFVYVADTNLRRVQQFSLQGDYIAQVFDDDFERLDGVGADARGNVYVTDQFTNLVTWYKGKGSCS